MKKYLFRFLVLYVAIIAGTITSAFAQSAKEQKFQRNKTSGKMPGSSFNKASSVPVEVQLKIDERQTVAATGIKFSIQWINHSDKAVTLFNLIDGVGLFFLTNDSYIPIPASTALINVRGPWKMKEPCFKIDDIFINNVKQDTDVTTLETITIPGHCTYTANLRIAEVIKFDPKMIGHYPDPNSPRFKPPKGEYKIKFTVSVISAPSSKIAITESLEIPDVVVKYGL
ncbi:hypothetical protein [Niabella beijingensis]|uniref:hypothetical protein n=1 Tax=Niabella beijingensis TaxID=2872700 RepID=UPI001CBC5E62|nr:hypothetical protein [Niabella beijingensis]MBZ4192165.1 hypothetical protein [Niabella beijingensis]